MFGTWAASARISRADYVGDSLVALSIFFSHMERAFNHKIYYLDYDSIVGSLSMVALTQEYGLSTLIPRATAVCRGHDRR